MSPTVATRILLVEDDPDIADVVRFILTEHGFAPTWASDGDAGLQSFRHQPPALVILDLNLPGLPGLELFRAMRETDAAVPVIMLTSRADEADRVLGLELGADDYVTKPFSPRELAARVKAVLRRHGTGQSGAGSGMPLAAGPLVLDPEAWRVTCGGVALTLTRSEFRLLECLVRYPARVFERDVLVDRLCNGEGAVTDRSIDAVIKRIRRKFDSLQPPLDPIASVYGVGYRLNPELLDPSA